MMFTATVNYYNDDTMNVEIEHLFVCADTLKDVTEKVSEFYGEDQIDSLEIAPFSPDDMLIFREDYEELFYEVKNRLNEEVVW